MKKYIQAIGIWVLIIPLAILNGGFRENVLRNVGAIALPLSGISLSVCIFIVAFLLIPKLKNCKAIDYVFIGIMWFVLTNMFDLAMILSEGGGLGDLLSSYDFTTGNLWIVVVLTTLVSPRVVAKLKKNR